MIDRERETTLCIAHGKVWAEELQLVSWKTFQRDVLQRGAHDLHAHRVRQRVPRTVRLQAPPKQGPVHLVEVQLVGLLATDEAQHDEAMEGWRSSEARVRESG